MYGLETIKRLNREAEGKATPRQTMTPKQRKAAGATIEARALTTQIRKDARSGQERFRKAETRVRLVAQEIAHVLSGEVLVTDAMLRDWVARLGGAQ